MSYTKIDSCRTCSGKRLDVILDLGRQPLANDIIEVLRIQNSIPLVLVRCEKCGLVQLNTNVEPSLMFSQYHWVTSTSSSSVKHCRNFVKSVISEAKKIPSSALEIGSNDGTLLYELVETGVGTVVGVDPAENLVKDYRDSISGEVTFFGRDSANELLNKYGKFDVLIARNVFSHIPSFKDVIAGIYSLMHDESLFFMEFHSASEILKGNHFDSIYHEHTYYHSIKSVTEVMVDFNLYPFTAFDSPISGGSVVLVSSRQKQSYSEMLDRLIEEETSSGVHTKAKWLDFGDQAKYTIEYCKTLLAEYSNRKICAFGASARSSTLLNAFGVKPRQIISIADNNPRKWRKFSPGTGIAIESVKEMIARNPDMIILFPFNFKDEILEQISHAGWSGDVLLPIPYPPSLLKI